VFYSYIVNINIIHYLIFLIILNVNKKCHADLKDCPYRSDQIEYIKCGCIGFMPWIQKCSISKGLKNFCSTNNPDPFEETPVNLTMAIVGDFGLGTFPRRILQMISKESEAAIFVGDFDYEDSPETWQNFTSMYLPENFPLFSLIGNHDSDNWYGASGYQSYINERINRLNLKCMGEVGMTQVCSYKGIMMFLSGAGSFKNKQDFAKINDVAQQMLGGIFNIAAWHGNMCNYTVGSIDRGNFADYTGWEIFEKARKMVP